MHGEEREKKAQIFPIVMYVFVVLYILVFSPQFLLLLYISLFYANLFFFSLSSNHNIHTYNWLYITPRKIINWPGKKPPLGSRGWVGQQSQGGCHRLLGGNSLIVLAVQSMSLNIFDPTNISFFFLIFGFDAGISNPYDLHSECQHQRYCTLHTCTWQRPKSSGGVWRYFDIFRKIY